jgi:hypothetical protein
VRVKLTAGGTTTIYIGNYFEWVSASVTRTYYYAGSVRVAERVGSTVYYLFGDHPSTPLRACPEARRDKLSARPASATAATAARPCGNGSA